MCILQISNVIYLNWWLYWRKFTVNGRVLDCISDWTILHWKQLRETTAMWKSVWWRCWQHGVREESVIELLSRQLCWKSDALYQNKTLAYACTRWVLKAYCNKIWGITIAAICIACCKPSSFKYSLDLKLSSYDDGLFINFSSSTRQVSDQVISLLVFTGYQDADCHRISILTTHYILPCVYTECYLWLHCMDTVRKWTITSNNRWVSIHIL